MMKSLSSIILGVIICIALILCCSASLFAKKVLDIDIAKPHFSVSLMSGEVMDKGYIDFRWLDENRLLYRKGRQLKLISDVRSENPKQITITDFLMIQDDGNTAPYYYISELDLIVFVEEMPEFTVKMYDGDGHFVDYLVLQMKQNKFKLDYIDKLQSFLVLSDSKLLLAKSWNRFDIISENVDDYAYKKNASEVLIFKPTVDACSHKEYDISIINIDRKQKADISTKVIYADYYPDTNIIYYATLVDENTCNLDIVTYDTICGTINIKNKNAINSILFERCGDNIKPKLKYIPSINGFMSIVYEINNPLHPDATTLYLLDNNLNEVVEPIANISDFIYNDNTDDVILLYDDADNDSHKIEHRNINDWTNITNISNLYMNDEKSFIFDKNSNTFGYFECNDNKKKKFIVYSLTYRKNIMTKSDVKEISNIFINMSLKDIIAISYKIKNDKYVTYFYNTTTGKTERFDNSYYAVPYSTESLLIIEYDNGFKANMYLHVDCIERSNTVTNVVFNKSPKHNKIFSFGFKGSGSLTFLTDDTDMLNCGYEASVFFGLTAFNFLMFEVDFIYGQRSFFFNPNNIVGEDPLLVKNISVIFNMFSIQPLLNCIIPIGRDTGIYLTFGGRFNFNISSTLKKSLFTGSSSSEDFSNKINTINIDILGGIGLMLFRTKKTSIFIDILFYFNVESPFKPSYLTEYVDILDVSVYPFAAQLSIGFSF